MNSGQVFEPTDIDAIGQGALVAAGQLSAVERLTPRSFGSKRPATSTP